MLRHARFQNLVGNEMDAGGEDRRFASKPAVELASPSRTLSTTASQGRMVSSSCA